MSRRRLSTRSAITPPMRAKASIGAEAAKATRPSENAERSTTLPKSAGGACDASSSTSQPCATDCIQVQSVAQSWLMLELASQAPPALFGSVGKRSAFWLGLVAFAASAPMLAFTLIGGVIADRVDKRRLLIRTQSVMMLSALAMSVLSFTHRINIPLVVLLAFITGTAMSLNMPGYQALVPSLVPREDLTNAIALNSAQFNLSRVLGPTIGGFVMAWWGVPANFLLNALSFLAVIFALTQIQYPAQPQQDDSAGLWQRLGG